MDTNKRTLYAFFDETRQYCAPLYQRSYVCSEEKQWEPLWSEIKERAKRYMEQQKNEQRSASAGMHFLGAIEAVEKKTSQAEHGIDF